MTDTETTQTEDKKATTVSSLHRYSTWVHVGPDADNCEDVTETTCDCSNPLHFHAWIRLPNQLQHREIREKALAAKARRVRQLRETDSDVALILEDELDRLARQGDTVKELIVDDVISRDAWRDMTDARYEVLKEDEESDEPRYAAIDNDRIRFADLSEKAEADRTQAEQEEFTELESHLDAYDKALQKAWEGITNPKREALLERDINSLIDMLRDMRIEVESNETYIHVYAINTWLVGTRVQPDGDRKFGSVTDIEELSPIAVEAIKDAYEDLEVTQQQELGNS